MAKSLGLSDAKRLQEPMEPMEKRLQEPPLEKKGTLPTGVLKPSGFDFLLVWLLGLLIRLRGVVSKRGVVCLPG